MCRGSLMAVEAGEDQVLERENTLMAVLLKLEMIREVKTA